MKTDSERKLVQERIALAVGEVVGDGRLGQPWAGKDLARSLGVEPAYVSMISGCSRLLPADLAVLITRRTGDARLMSSIAEMCGGLYIQLPEESTACDMGGAIAASRDAAMAAAAAAAAAVDALLAAIQDGMVTDLECDGVEAAAMKAVVAVQELTKVARKIAATGGRPEMPGQRGTLEGLDV